VANIQKVRRKSGFAYRVLIRSKNSPNISCTFPTKKLATYVQYAARIETSRHQIQATGITTDKAPIFSLVISSYISNENLGSRPSELLRKLNKRDC
jgi:hypothetical protein